MRYIFYCRNSTQETRSTFSRCTYYGYVGMETRHCTCYYFTGRSLKGSAKSSVRSAPLERLTLTKVPVRWSAVEKRSDSHQPEPASQPFTTTMRTAKKSLEAASGHPFNKRRLSAVGSWLLMIMMMMMVAEEEEMGNVYDSGSWRVRKRRRRRRPRFDHRFSSYRLRDIRQRQRKRERLGQPLSSFFLRFSPDGNDLLFAGEVPM